MLFRRYFREEHIKHNFSIPFYLLIGFGPIVVILLLLMAGRGDLLHLYEGKLLFAMGCFSLLLAIVLSKFKEPHLQKQDVLSAFPYGRKSEANRFIMQVGYYNLVNMFRLCYAGLYEEAHPEATKDTIASESGFTSRFTYYKAKNAMISIDPDLVRDVRL